MRQTLTASFAVLAAACSLVTGATAFAQDAARFPDHPVTIVVPYPAGGTADVLPRIIGEQLTKKWGQPIVIENRTGAGGNIGADAVARAQPDGYTLLATPPGPLVVNQNLYKNLSYDPTKFTPITTLAAAPNVLAVRRDFPAKTAEAFIEYVKQNPGKVTVATQGNGTTSHLTGAMFARAIGSEVVFVPYRGTAPALADLVGSQVDLFFDNIGSMYAQHQAGQARILAVTSDKRSPLLPDTPTLAELGLEDFASSTWFGMVAPAGTPDAIADKIHDAVVEVLQMPEVKERFLKAGVEPVGESRTDMAAFMDDERKRWKAVIDTANVAIN